jgi:phospholipid/cholesterol/gamma-HCH transport system substrate-binding protein
LQIKTETRVGLFVVIAIGIFFYMSMHIGVFRLDRGNYKLQLVYFNDVSGLEKKAQVKIAGVPVGWVEKVELLRDDKHKAKAFIMIDRKYVLHTDAYAYVDQEGVLGAKYLVINPGDPALPELPEQHALSKPGRSHTSVSDILHKVGNIATNIEDVTTSLRENLGGMSGRDSIQESVQHFNIAAEKIAALTEMLDRTMSHNEQSINETINNIKEFTRDLRDNVPDMGKDLQRVANKIEETLERDFSGVVKEVENSFKNINAVAGKIDEGQGLIGKLINDDSTYHDIKEAVSGIKKYISKTDRINIVLDSHGEFMYRQAEHQYFEDAKGYLQIRIHPSEDHFYMIDIVGRQRGNLKRKSVLKNWYDERGDLFLPSRFFEGEVKFLPELIGRIDTEERELDAYKIGVQIGKVFKNFCLRFGLFEGFVGSAVDFHIPFRTDKLRWISTMEMFDFRGRDRIADNRPHLKWINRVFLLRNIYAAFGVDDFISRNNTSGFFGMGLRFCDDDLKYLASKIGFAGIT